MRWRFRSRLKSSRHLAAARGHNPGGRFLASCCIRAIGQKRSLTKASHSGRWFCPYDCRLIRRLASDNLHVIQNLRGDPIVTEPIRLCRYRSLASSSAEWARDSILHSKHYFASPLSFNDPFDCRPNFELRGTRAQLLQYYERLVARHMPELGRDARRAEARRRVTDPAFDPRIPRNMDGVRRMYHDTVTSKVGVMCLSEVHDDILMWAHYADSHRGVCLVFDPSDPFFATAQPVLYRDDRPHVNPLLHTHDQMLDAAMLTKSKHWFYEREWRIIQYSKGAGVYTVPAGALVQVVLGAEMSAEVEAKVRQWASEAVPKISVIRASLSPTQFKVEIKGAWRRDA